MAGVDSPETQYQLVAVAAHLLDCFNAVAYSPDGNLIASGSSNRTVRIWDAQSGHLLRTLEGHDRSVTSVSWSHDGQRIASGSDDDTVRIWDAPSGQLLGMLGGHSNFATSLSWSNDDLLIACGSYDNTIRIWRTQSGQLLGTLEGHVDSVYSVCWSPDGQRIASGSYDNTVRVWDAPSGQLLGTLEGHAKVVTSVNWSNDSQRIASGSHDGTVRIWDAPSGQLLGALEGHAKAVTSVSWSPDGQRIASGSYDDTIRIWNALSGQLLSTLEGHASQVNSVSWSNDSQRIASGSDDKTVRIWDAPSGQLLRTFEGHASQVNSVSWSNDGLRIASWSYDNSVRIWDAKSGKSLRSLEGHVHSVTSVSWSSDGQRIASGSNDDTVRIWDAQSGQLLHTLEGHASYVNSVSWSSDHQRIASGSSDDTVRIWDAESGQLLRILEGHSLVVAKVSWSHDGQRIACVSGLRTVNILDAESGQLLRTLEGHADGVTSVSWSHDGLRIASGSYDKTVRIWDARSGQLLRTLEGQASLVTSVSWSPDGQRIASGSRDNIVRIWDVATGNCLSEVRAARAAYALLDVAFIPVGPIQSTFGVTVLNDPDIVVHVIDTQALAAVPAQVTQVISAKIVLVGESNVGKSYLAHRIATGKPPEEGAIQSTHGMKFWPLEPEQLHPDAKASDGQRRDIVLWDMGGQEEYRLIHQLFLHDTTVALLLLDPTRGATPFQEIEIWNKYLEKQLQGRSAVKLLVGAKLDQPSDVVDRQALNQLCQELKFDGYFDSSALTGRGLPELRQALAKAINWDALGRTSRPELFQRIRDEIEKHRKLGEVVLYVSDLHRALSDQTPTEEQRSSVCTVTEQLAAQGVIACSQVATGEPVLVLQVQEIERYAGSLIVAARNNPRAVPALELRAIAQPGFSLPGIPESERLPREQERSILECCVRLLLEHGICFEHENLLVFPTLFATAAASATPAQDMPHAVSLYYDFAGAIDNIYASLVAWLVLAQDFGRVRLWHDRAEFAMKDGGLCGLRKVSRPGGFAHADVYFESETPPERREQFISFVEDHLHRTGVQILEHIDIHCPCGHDFGEETLRKRIARGDKDIACPLCETRHSLLEGAAKVRERDPKIQQHTWALKYQVEEARKTVTRQAVHILASANEAKSPTRPIRLLHLSDLHFDKHSSVASRLQWLLDDVKLDTGLGFKELDYLVVSGDFTDKACNEGFEKAFEFLSGLIDRFALSAERCILVPGNHDVANLREAYEWRENAQGLDEGTWIKQGDIILARNVNQYAQRFKQFSDNFYHKFLQSPYPADYAQQGISIPFWETGIQFLTLNSCWQIDQFNRQRAGIHPDAVANAIAQVQKQEDDARKSGQLAKNKPVLRIAVWHHAVTAPDYKMKDIEFLSNLQKNVVKLALHGDVHEMRRDIIGYWHERKIHIIGSGSFGARATDRPEATPCLYNVLEIDRDLKSMKVHTRRQFTAAGAWGGWHEWPEPNNPDGRLPYYEVAFS